MNQYDCKILELLKKRRTLLELETLSHRYPSQVAQSIHQLKNKGYMIEKILEGNGLKYTLVRENRQCDYQEITITKVRKQFKMLVISDTHIGRKDANSDKWDAAYDYAEANKIPYVLHLGDLVEGGKWSKYVSKELPTTQQQIDYVTSIYPKRKNVTTLLVLGNHDRYGYDENINIQIPIERRRLDIVVLGDNTALLNIKNLKILFNHMPTHKKPPAPEVGMKLNNNELTTKYQNVDLILNGHFHVSKFYFSTNGTPIIYLSSIGQKLENSIRTDSMNELTFFGNHGHDFNAVNVKSIVFEPKVKVVSEMEIPLKKKSSRSKISSVNQSRKIIKARAYHDAGCDYSCKNNGHYRKFFIEKHTFEEYELYCHLYDEVMENLLAHENSYSKVIKK